MKKNKKLKLKLKFKLLLALIVIIIIGSIYGYNKYQIYLYEQTNEFKFLELGYTKEEIKILEENFKSSKLDEFLNNDKDNLIFDILDGKYYIAKYFDEYYNYIKEEKISVDEGIQIINTHIDERYYEEIFNANTSLNTILLVNKYYTLSNEYVPENLVTISTKHSWGEYGTQKATEETYDAFISMASDALTQDITLMINSSYRSFDSQETVYNNYKDTRGERYADEIAARPGHSEHQTGLALDIFSTETSNQANFVNSKAYTYLKDNAHKFGFILRYPEDKTDITGYAFESWHYRYVGNEIATYIYNNNITFDEYYAFYIEN